MMKITIAKFSLIFFLFCSNFMFSQSTNPDGDAISLHITPYFLGGDRILKTFDSRGNEEFENKQLNGQLNYSLMAMIPISDMVTLKPFYETIRVEKMYELNKYGVTFSFYLN